MTTRRKRQLLWMTAAAAAAGGVFVIALAAALPMDSQAVEVVANPTALPGNAIAANLPSLDELGRVWGVALGHEVKETAPPTTPNATTAEIVPVNPHLIGTIIESGHSLAMILGQDGKTIFYSVGDQIEGAKIAAISADSITLELDGKETICRVEKPPAPPAAAKPAIIPGEEP